MTTRDPWFSFSVTAVVPEQILRDHYDGLVKDDPAYGESWDEFLAGEAESFRDYASGWWLNDAVRFDLAPTESRPELPA